MKLDTDIKYLKGVGERRAAMLSRLGVSDVNALVRLYPRVYEDWSRIKSINEAQIGEICCIKGIVGSPVRKNLIRKGLTLYKTEITRRGCGQDKTDLSADARAQFKDDREACPHGAD